MVFSIAIGSRSPLAPTQFGPACGATIRDVGTQVSLGIFVPATFRLPFLLTLSSTTNSRAALAVRPPYPPACALALPFIELGVAIYFTHQVTRSIS